MIDDSSDSRPRTETPEEVSEPQTNVAPDTTRALNSDRNGDVGGRTAAGDGGGPSSPLSAATARIRRDPALVLPFFVAGIVLIVVDWARRRDPLPTLVSGGGEGKTISVEFAGYPTGVPETARSLEALVDLKLPYLAWGIGLEAFALLIVAVAGSVTIARALEDRSGVTHARTEPLSIRRVPAYFGLVVLFSAAARLLGSLGDLGLILGIPLLVVVFVAMVRLFVAPAFVVTGAGPVAALRRSARATRGSGWSIAALVLAFGLAAWLLTLVPLPYAGTVLSSALVASVHAVAVAVVRERSDGSAASDG